MATSMLSSTLRAFPASKSASGNFASAFKRVQFARPIHMAPVRSPAASRLALRAGQFTVGTSLALAFTLPTSTLVNCEAVPASSRDSPSGTYRPYATPQAKEKIEVESMVNVSHLGFGTVCGLCSGIFFMKGLKFIAFFLGGGFVLLQYLSSRSFVTVNWPSFAKSYDSAITKRTEGVRGRSRVEQLMNGLVDMLTADFQGRATFLAAFVLGLRMA